MRAPAKPKPPAAAPPSDLSDGSPEDIWFDYFSKNEPEPKVVSECTYPLTGKACVSLIVTDLAVIQVTEAGLVLKELAPGWTYEEVQAQTGAPVTPAEDLREIAL